MLPLPAAAFRIGALPKLSWFKCDEMKLHWVTVASMNGTEKLFNRGFPPAWLGPARKQLASATLAQRTAVQWAVPRAELEAAQGQEGMKQIFSPPVYSAGAAWQLLVQVQKAEGGKRYVGVFVRPCSYSHGGTLVAPLRFPLACSYAISYAVPGQAQPKPVCGCDATLVTGGGSLMVFTASSPSDLDSHLVDGCLRLQATVKAL
jgi:hypothetical protein